MMSLILQGNYGIWVLLYIRTTSLINKMQSITLVQKMNWKDELDWIGLDLFNDDTRP